MANEEKERIVIPDENGDEHLFEVLFTFDVDETEKSYMVVVPVETENDGDEEVEVFAFRFEETGDQPDDIQLYPIDTDEEWDMVEEMLNTFSEEDE
ncbi:DUF1292 domain-containing protein [Bacillus solimangrovi]|uniref:UPF0473 protein BFG57_05230 n=1 Tax=Bacillus solimangrovi TaxID=1305675 RepID=A0A1E5LBP4_9BACI|nr:DUF1292 domain-containing protein [Bacillus solimangrovi]OEH91518.1 hypothetical protein BFG57_05230 [Bacillus solimangrovi]